MGFEFYLLSIYNHSITAFALNKLQKFLHIQNYTHSQKEIQPLSEYLLTLTLILLTLNIYDLCLFF